jgi:mono/diheme cytochrome c family protein
MIVRALAVVLWIALSLPAVGGARSDVPEEIRAQENPERLEENRVRYFARQFKAKCSRCHGLDGKGGGKEAAEQAVPPPDFTDAAFMSSRSDGQLFYQILMGGGERCAMPSFGPESDHGWDESKIWQMVAYVRRFSDGSD